MGSIRPGAHAGADRSITRRRRRFAGFMRRGSRRPTPLRRSRGPSIGSSSAVNPASPSGSAPLDRVELRLELRDALKLDVELAIEIVHAIPALIRDVDEPIEFGARDGALVVAALPDRRRPLAAPFACGCHWSCRLPRAERILR